jgi:hypothetical protein
VVNSETLRLFGMPPRLLEPGSGLKLYGRLDEATFRIVVLVLLLISGITLLPSPWSKTG